MPRLTGTGDGASAPKFQAFPVEVCPCFGPLGFADLAPTMVGEADAGTRGTMPVNALGGAK